MTVASIDHVIERIKVASEHSPIAVFRSNLSDRVDAVFASTVDTMKRIHRNDPRLIGVYWKDDPLMSIGSIRDHLLDAAE